MISAFVVVGAVVGLWGAWQLAPTSGWAAACILYVAWVWAGVRKLDAKGTAANAAREDPKRTVSDLLLLVASIASLFALIFVFGQARSSTPPTKEVTAALAFVSVVLSWLLVHTLFTLRYAELYYSREGRGINFNQTEPPTYAEFAYLAFTVGMTFQVSDTNIQTSDIRVTVLRHMVLSYLFGSVIIATTVNLIAGLAT
jgi:uncharacterized membrane protein